MEAYQELILERTERCGYAFLAPQNWIGRKHKECMNMKKGLIILCVMLLFVIATAGCKENNSMSQDGTKSTESFNQTESSESGGDNRQDGVRITDLHIDWPYYAALDSLTAAASNIFEGKVTNVFFDVVNLSTGESANELDDPRSCMLYTVYEVEIINTYKGVNDGKAYIKVEGGIQGFKEAEQCQVMQNAGVFDENLGIVVSESFEPLTVGDTYLFLTNKRASTYHTIINDTQFAFRIENTGKNDMFTYEEVKAHVTKQPTDKQS